VTDGLVVDFGSGTNQVARGSDVAGLTALNHGPVVPVGTLSLALGVDNADGQHQFLSGTARLDPAPGGGKGRLGVQAGGLYTVLGSTADTAASGDHVHAIATESVAGFMSASDKIKLDNLVANLEVLSQTFLLQSGTGQVWGSGTAAGFWVPAFTGQILGWDLIGAPSGSLAVEILHGPFGSFPPAVSLTGGQPLVLQNGQQGQASVLWNFEAGEVLEFQIQSVVVVNRAWINLRVVHNPGG
jgi:hypothetical protein